MPDGIKGAKVKRFPNLKVTAKQTYGNATVELWGIPVFGRKWRKLNEVVRRLNESSRPKT